MVRRIAECSGCAALLVPLIFVAGLARAELGSLFVPGDGAGTVRAIWDSAPQRDAMVRHLPGDLIDRNARLSLFAPLPERARPSRARPLALALPGADDFQLAQLRDLIGQAEAGSKGYDAINYGARVLTPRAPTAMTIGEIDVWIRATPGQPHAIGRYQFIPATLRRLVRKAGLSVETRFTPAVQDQLADILLAEAGVRDFQEGDMSKGEFMLNLAKIWAGFPTSNGRSYYHGYAGNRATMTWARFKEEMAAIFPG